MKHNISLRLLAFVAVFFAIASAHAMRPTGSNVGKIALKTVAAQHETYYYPTADTDAARGIALENAISDAPISATVTIGPGRYYVTTELALKAGQTIKFEGGQVYHDDYSIDVFTITGVEGVAITGNGVVEGAGLAAGNQTDEAGLRTTSLVYSLQVSGIEFRNFRGPGISLESGAGGERRSGVISNCSFYMNRWGVYVKGGSEYWRLEALQVVANTTGILIGAGNVILANSTITANGTGLYLDGAQSANNGHGSVTNCQINHNTIYGLYADSITYGESFVGNQFWGEVGQIATIWDNYSGALFFSAGTFGAPFVWISVGGHTLTNFIRNVWFSGGEPTFTDGGTTGATPFWIQDCVTDGGLNSTQNMGITIGSNGNTGLGTYTPDKAFDINCADGDCFQLTYNDSNGSAATKTNFAVSSSGDLTITPSGGTVTVVNVAKSNYTERVVASVPGVNFFDDDTAMTLYTVPAGKSLVVTRVVLRNVSSSAALAAGGLGFDANATDWGTFAAQTNLTGATKVSVLQASATGGGVLGAATDVFKIKFTTTAAAECTGTVDVIGYEF